MSVMTVLGFLVTCGLGACSATVVDPGPGAGGDAGASGSDSGPSGTKKTIGQSCTCPGLMGNYTCQGTDSACTSDLTCVGDDTFGGKCYGTQCCSGSTCDPFTPAPGTGTTGCPTGQSCTIFNNKAYGYCAP